MRIAVYVRTSTIRQAQAQSCEQQLDRLQTHLRAQGVELPDHAIFRDDGYSGAKLKRPGLDRLRDGVAAAEFDRIVITAPDRLARNYVHQVLLLEEFERSGCRVEFLDRPMSQDPHDQLLLQIRGAVAEYERTLIAERMRRGRLAKLRAGLILPWTRPPYGYRLDAHRPRDPAGVHLDEAEAAVVVEIFAWYIEEGRSLFGLAKYLQGRAIPSPSGKTYWSTATLRAILTNPTYTGQVYAGRMQYRPPQVRRSATHPIGHPHGSVTWTAPEQWIAVATVPAVVTSEQFNAAAAKLRQNQGFARRNTKAEYLLRALVSCGICQLACIARRSHPSQYYACTGKENEGRQRLGQACRSRYIPAGQLDEVVWQDLCELLSDASHLREALARAHSGQWLPQELQARREGLRKALVSLERQLDRLTDAYLKGVIPLVEYERRRRELEQKRDALKEQAGLLTSRADQQSKLAGVAASVEEFRGRVVAGLGRATFEQKRHLVELLVDRVIVTEDEVEIRYVIPTSSKGEGVRFCRLRTDYFHHPAPGQQHEPLPRLRQFHHLELDSVRRGGLTRVLACVPLVDERDLDRLARRLLQARAQVRHLRAVLLVGGGDLQRQQVPERVDRDVDLAPLAPLRPVVARPRSALGRRLHRPRVEDRGHSAQGRGLERRAGVRAGRRPSSRTRRRRASGGSAGRRPARAAGPWADSATARPCARSIEGR
jgi:site-specific DNA recombinase